MAKIRYEVDPHNRLAKIGPGKFRTVLDGQFSVNEDNKLSYHVKRSSGLDTPQEIKFSGGWSLDEGHNLVLTLDKWNNQCEGNKLVLQGELMGAGSNELAFTMTTRDTATSRSDLVVRGRGRTSGLGRVYMLKLGGKWQADKYNRLCFDVEKQGGASDSFVLRGSWNINKQNEIVYSHRQVKLKTKDRSDGTLTFKGHWDISKGNRLSYVLNKDLGSQFDLKVIFNKATKDGLNFSIGAGAAPLKKRFTLSGAWKIKSGLGLVLEAEYSDGKPCSLNFGAEYPLLKGQGEAFLKALASKKEVAFVGGMGFRW